MLGGHLEENETIFECAKREVYEEAHISIKNIKFLSILEDSINGYLSFYVLADYEKGELIPNLKENILSLKWIHVNDIPKELYTPFRRFIS